MFKNTNIKITNKTQLYFYKNVYKTSSLLSSSLFSIKIYIFRKVWINYDNFNYLYYLNS